MNRKWQARLRVGMVASLLFGTVICSFLMLSKPTHAAIDQTIIKKAIGYGISQCYKQGNMVSPVTANTYNAGWGPYGIVDYGGSYALPTGAYNGVYYASCSELLNGNGVNGTFPGIFSIAGINAPQNADNTSAFNSFMVGMGYTKSEASSGKCGAFTWKAGDSEDTLKLCAETDSSGTIIGKLKVTGDGGVNVSFKVTDTTVEPVCSQLGSWASSCSVHSYTQGSTNFDALMGEIMGDLIQHRKNGILGGSWKLVETVATEPMGDTLATYTITSKTTAANKATSYLTGFSGSNLALTPNERLALLQDYMLNFYAVERYGGACDLDASQASIAQNAGYSLIETSMFGSGLQKCWVRPTKNQNSSVAGFDENGYFTGKPLYYADVVSSFGGSVNDLFEGDKEKCNSAAAIALSSANSMVDQYYFGNTTKEEHDRGLATIESLNKIKDEHGQYWYEENGAIVCYPFTNTDGTTSNTPTGSTDLPGTPDQDNSDPGQDASDPCFDAGATLGWIVCPVLDIVGKATTGIYENVIEPFLEIKSDWMGQGSNSVYGGWTQFRDFANIIFAIAFILVILSQVTGIGISNYGVKKVLPRLIMVVVLVNISYILCQLATDISNILGSGLQNLFVDMAGKIGAPSGVSETVSVYGGSGTAPWFSLSGVLSTILTVIIGGGAAWGLAVTWEIWLIPLLLTVLGCAVGVLFFFVILGVRQAGVLILTALAPVAIICYALPNTKSFFDKWKKMYIGLLVVYPICGALIGGGQFASALLISAGGGSNFFYDLVAMLVQVVPFFMIPSILRGSMAAMGNLGMKISGIGRQVGNFAQRTVGNARPVKEKQQEWLRNNNQRRDSRLAARLKRAADEARSDVDAYDNRMKRAGVDINDDSKVRAFLGDEYGTYRRLKNRAAARNYRANQARKRYEGSVMEDAMADANARRDLLTPGSARYEKMVAGAMREQRNKDDAGQIAMYEEGKVEAFGGGGIVKGDSLEDLAKEHAALLKHVADNPTDETAASKLRAVQTMLGRMGSNGFDKMENNLGELMANHSQFDDSNSDGLRIASSHLSRNFASQIKANSRSLDALLNDVNKGGTLAHQSTFSQQQFDDLKGGRVNRYVSSHYSSKGAQSIKAENVNDLGDAYYDNLLRATINGDLKGQDLEQVLSVFGEAEAAAAAGKITLKGEVKQRIKAIKNAAYASGHMNGQPRSEGSRMIGAAGAAGIDGIVKQIESAGSWSTMTAQQKQQYSDLVNNITDSLKQDAHTVENVRQLQSALATARTKGIETAVTGGSLISQVGSADLHQFKVPRGAKQKVTMPTGWTLTPGGSWIDVTTGNPLSATDAMKAKQIMEHNNSIDIENSAS